ncbi:hypothetical protein KFL_000040280 [Klebsormidium nitens]|uniref:Uncharacterized protein n=1 Tax=Klebsormidium nitens TaxID=105231 RepID=A0A1Y1HMJ8_KLENI|nr:hypothetical protein KFL_000040280 [Klebsormidium nitens]|eukprot:GAQ77826.1 hypothetical protein KFL_000040280 [Klebsormidium nitens]
MALSYEGMAFLKAAIEVVPGEKQPLYSKQRGSFSESRICAANGNSHSAKPVAGTGKQTGESDFVHPRLKPVQLSSQQNVAKSPSEVSHASAESSLEVPSITRESPLSRSPLDHNVSAGFDGSDFESCAGSPQAAASWRLTAEEAGDTPWAGDTPRSVGSSLSSERERQIESLEVQLASKSSEIQRLADVCSGAELALAERDKEAAHLGALARNLEEQILAKNEVLDLSQELIASLEERLVALEVQREALEARAGEYGKCLLEMQEELERGRRELEGLREEKGSTLRRSEELEKLVGCLEGQVTEKTEGCAVLEARLQVAERVAAGRVGALTEKITRLQTGLAENARALRCAEELTGELKRQLQEKEDVIKESKAQCELVLKEGNAVCERALEAQAEILQATEARLKTLESDVERKDGNLEAVGAHVADLTRQLEEREEECERAQAGVERLRGQLADSQAKNKTLRKALEEESQIRKAVEEELEARRLVLGEKEAEILELRAKLAGNAMRGRERERCECVGVQVVTSPESSWGDVEAASAKTMALDAEHLEDTGSSQVETSDAESVADAGEATVGELTLAGVEGQEEGGLAPAGNDASGMTQLECERGGCGAPSDSHVAFATEVFPTRAGFTWQIASVCKGTCLESPATGLLKALVNVVSRRCSKDSETGTTAPRGLKALLTN